MEYRTSRSVRAHMDGHLIVASRAMAAGDRMLGSEVMDLVMGRRISRPEYNDEES